MAHDDETEAFARFAESLPGDVALLIDTYDTLEAARHIVVLAPRLAARGISIRAIRLDSGDLAALAQEVRQIFDQGGLANCRIFASGDLDEHEIGRLLDAGAPIDGFGIGTRMTTSADLPYLNCAYKLQEYAGIPRRKRSTGKATWPGCKQVYRFHDEQGVMHHDLLAGEWEEWEDSRGEPLLRPAMRQGQRLHPAEPLMVARERLRHQLDRLPVALRSIEAEAAYPVLISEGLRQLAERMDAAQAARDRS
jgi:nicotinate phosphoribosyltransferase